jgi:hypothetical protein
MSRRKKLIFNCLGTPISASMFLQILTEAEERARAGATAEVRINSLETVQLCLQRLQLEGVTREELKRAAIIEGGCA